MESEPRFLRLLPKNCGEQAAASVSYKIGSLLELAVVNPSGSGGVTRQD